MNSPLRRVARHLAPIAAWFLFNAVNAAELRIGIIGTDTSHVPNFARTFNDPKYPGHIKGARVTCAFKGGSPDIESSRTRVDKFAEEISSKYGVKIVPTIKELAEQVDAIMIESVDGRPHLEQAKAVFSYGKPVFIDKPIAGTLRDTLELIQLARELKVPLFSSSSLRFKPTLDKLKKAPFGEIRGAISTGPCSKEEHHPDLFWYGIHPTEALYAVMGQGCESVVRTATENTDVVTGTWTGGRVGILYGIRNAAAPYRVTVLGTKSVIDQEAEGRGTGAYDGLAQEIFKFFQTKVAPVSLDETLEIFAFMEAADESKRRGGATVKLSEVLAKNSPRRK
ncbi:MAG: Gfo/Idh/MocA family oxidoreductase [Opitutaceae bacterium]|nr:Gfo/Idh/MocA family oxidoreductase [Opitutaceae bacterium]